MDVKSTPLVQLYHDTRLSLIQLGDLTSLAAYVYRTLSLMTNHSLFPCFLLPFDLCRYPLMEEYVFADTWNKLNPSDDASGHYHQIRAQLHQDWALVTSFSAAGIFFCLLEKAKVVLFPGDRAADWARSPVGTDTWNWHENTENMHKIYGIAVSSLHWYFSFGRSDCKQCCKEARLTFLLLKDKETLVTHTCKLVL